MNICRDTEIMDENPESEIVFSETTRGFTSQIMIKQELLNQIQNMKLSLKTDEVFKRNNLFSQLKRKNQIYYFVNNKEFAVDIVHTKGSCYLPLITREEIKKNLTKIKPEICKTITTIHLGAVKILLKAAFQEGINSPVKMALLDNRINDRRDCILGAARGNLAYGKFMFTIYPKFGLDLSSKRLDEVLTFVHEFERSDLMNQGDKVFSITYLVSYALTNSHHSMTFKKQEYIEIDDIFSEIGSVEEKQFADIQQEEDSWAIDIAKNKRNLLQGNKIIDNLILCSKAKEETSQLRDISDKIDGLKRQLNSITNE